VLILVRIGARVIVMLAVRNRGVLCETVEEHLSALWAVWQLLPGPAHIEASRLN